MLHSMNVMTFRTAFGLYNVFVLRDLSFILKNVWIS